jgi:L-ascorbate metabolism protein UlaG (beta-lactamase superfamily)
MKTKWLICLVAASIIALGWSSSWAQTVKVTPLGAATGEFCVGDRAILFEDPTGVRVLIAPGRTVNGSGDARLPLPTGPTGGVHVLLIDHPHVDHLGDVFHTNCAGSASTAFAFPGESNAPEIAAVHRSAVLVGGELPDFLTKKISNVATALASPQPIGCPAAGLDNTFTVPRTVPCVGVIRGGTRTAVFTGATKGVKVTTIPAFHAAGASRTHVDELTAIDPDGTNAVADPGIPAGLTGYAGHETGYIIRFTNGLTVLWTGDSGLLGDWEVQSRFYRPNLAVVHGGDLFTMGPDEAAFAVSSLIKPRSVIPEHFNQVSTSGGAVVAGTKLERFLSQLKGQTSGKGGARAVIPLSGVTFEFDGAGNCVVGPGC